MSDEAWTRLREALAEEPGELAFRAASAVLDAWPGPGFAEAFAFAERTLAGWPDDCRVAPWTWTVAAVAGERGASWPLVRALREAAPVIGAGTVGIDRLIAAGLGGDIAAIELDRFAPLHHRDEGALLTVDAASWPRLRDVRRLAPEADGLAAFLASPLLPRLERLQFFLPFPRPRRAAPVFAYPQAAARLRVLELHPGRAEAVDLRPLLAAESLPALRELALQGDWFEGPVPDPLLGLAAEPVFGQVRTLRLGQLPEAVVVGILSRPDLRLERLELDNRFYMPSLVDRQQFACRLTTAGVAALPRSAFEHLEHLRVAHERVGDGLLDLVEATTPGRLRTLELIDVSLTDAGAARLARLPHLAGLETLNVQENPLTATGVTALVASPSLGRLRRLDLGSGWANPYYGGYCEPQAVGDAGVAALAASGLVGQLQSLSLRHAQVGARGVAALCAVAAPALRVLDLSKNVLAGADLAALPAGLRELGLSQCALDDAAVAGLAAADLARLRILELGYNSIAAAGAAALAGAASLARLWRLSLHDNFLGDAGLVALAGSPHLRQLLELDLEQDVWNYRGEQFGRPAAEAFAASATFANLDAFFGGIVDEYHGSRWRRPFAAADAALVRQSATLRPAVRHALDALDDVPDEDQPLEFVYHYDTPREKEQHSRGADFRGLPPLDETMDEARSRDNVDPEWMLDFLGEQASERKLRLFACACARRALALVPLEPQRALIEVVERFVDGEATWEECQAVSDALDQEAPPGDHDSAESYARVAVYNAARPDEPHEGARYAASQAVRVVLARQFVERPESVRGGVYLPEHHAQAALLRCIFGVPMRPVSFDPGLLAWRDGLLVQMARGIYEGRRFADLPALGDALEEAGCTDAEMLAHCRSAGEHVRGCWVLDLLLGKT